MFGVLPPAARQRSFRYGSVPAVSPPALHFPVRQAAGRSDVSTNFFSLDCARFARKGVRLGNTLGVFMSGLKAFGRVGFAYRKRLNTPVSNERDKTDCIL